MWAVHKAYDTSWQDDHVYVQQTTQSHHFFFSSLPTTMVNTRSVSSSKPNTRASSHPQNPAPACKGGSVQRLKADMAAEKKKPAKKTKCVFFFYC